MPRAVPISDDTYRAAVDAVAEAGLAAAKLDGLALPGAGDPYDPRVSILDTLGFPHGFVPPCVPDVFPNAFPDGTSVPARYDVDDEATSREAARMYALTLTRDQLRAFVANMWARAGALGGFTPAAVARTIPEPVTPSLRNAAETYARRAAESPELRRIRAALDRQSQSMIQGRESYESALSYVTREAGAWLGSAAAEVGRAGGDAISAFFGASGFGWGLIAVAAAVAFFAFRKGK